MVELRKRKERADPPPPPPSKRKSSSNVKKVLDKAKEAVTGKSAEPAAASAPTVGSTITLDDFSGEVETNEGQKTTLRQLVEASKAGVVLFTYPKASTPGCTTQACLFRDNYAPLTATGLSIYGLSRDSPKANTSFQTKQSLPYPLLCDPGASLIKAIGFAKAGSGTTRGVFAVDKAGKVLLAEAGGPQPTLDAAKRLVSTEGGGTEASAAPAPAPAESLKPEAAAAEGKANGAPTKADTPTVAAEVADSAAKLDAPTAAA